MQDFPEVTFTESSDYLSNSKNKYNNTETSQAVHTLILPESDESEVVVVCRFGEEVRIPRRALQENMLIEYAKRLGESQWKSDGMALRSGQLFYAVQSVATMIRGQTVRGS